MKAIKRIIAVVLLIVLAILIGYLIYTGSQLEKLNETEGFACNVIEKYS